MSRFKRGTLVEVRSPAEILTTLDSGGCLEGMPFMPEMLQFCGKRFRVGMVAHKTCEVARQTLKARRLDQTVHLEGLRCNGSAHGGCEAQCNLYWKDAWLKPVQDHGPLPAPADPVGPKSDLEEDDAARVRLEASIRLAQKEGDEDIRYSCQATRLYEATKPLAWWDPRQYLRDVTSGNHSVGALLRVIVLAMLTHALRHTPFGYRFLSRLRSRFHRWAVGRELPDFEGAISLDDRTPEGRLGLRPGDWVRIKTSEEITQTLNKKRKNRGMYFDVEMVPYCGQVARVRSSVTQLINEATGHMMKMQQPCIILEGVVCRGEYSECRLMCPRAIYPYWREIWLEPASSPSAPTSQK